MWRCLLLCRPLPELSRLPQELATMPNHLRIRQTPNQRLPWEWLRVLNPTTCWRSRRSCVAPESKHHANTTKRHMAEKGSVDLLDLAESLRIARHIRQFQLTSPATRLVLAAGPSRPTVAR
jgi:hypothetical protein